MPGVARGTYTLKRMRPKPETLGDRVRALRLSYGMSQVELGRRIGVSKTAMNNLEQGFTQDPYMSTLVGIADVLHVSLDRLVGRQAPPLE